MTSQKPVTHKTSDVADALQQIAKAQQRLRELPAKGELWWIHAAFDLFEMALAYKSLPEEVARRLTLLDSEVMHQCEHKRVQIITVNGRAGVEHMAQLVTGDEALAQVIRAANHYRKALGMEPLGPDGWSEPRGDAAP